MDPRCASRAVRRSGQGRELQELPRLATGGFGRGVAREHARELSDAVLPVHPLELRASAAAGHRLRDPELSLGERGDDREMRHAEDLANPAEPGETFADRARDGAADAGVYFIENQ